MNKWTEVFSAMLASLEFVLDKDNGGFCLIDLQGGNLGDIESDRFETAEEIIDRMDVYVNDCYLDDLEEEYDEMLENAGITPSGARKRNDPEGWSDFAKFVSRSPSTSLVNGHLFIENHKHEFDVMEMIAHHLAEVDLDDIMEQKA